MTLYYLDASAIVKRYLREAGSHWVSGLVQQAKESSLFSSELVTVEVVCALSRAQRAGRIGIRKRNQATRLFLTEAERFLDRIPASTEILLNASELALRHPLRAYDAVHLATALAVTSRLLRHGLPAPIFISADENLVAAARAEGLIAEDPKEHT